MRVILGFAGFLRITLGSAGLSGASPGSAGFLRVMLGFLRIARGGVCFGGFLATGGLLSGLRGGMCGGNAEIGTDVTDSPAALPALATATIATGVAVRSALGRRMVRRRSTGSVRSPSSHLSRDPRTLS
jgi:hypothetical protein